MMYSIITKAPCKLRWVNGLVQTLISGEQNRPFSPDREFLFHQIKEGI